MNISWKQPAGFDLGDGVCAVAVELCGSPFAGAPFWGRFDDSRFQNAASEIALVEMLSQNQLISVLQFTQGEDFRQQLEPDSRIFYFVAQAADRIGQDFSMVAKGGATLAPINEDVKGGIPADLIEQVTAKEKEIVSGLFRVDIAEAQPPASSKAAAE